MIGMVLELLGVGKKKKPAVNLDYSMFNGPPPPMIKPETVKLELLRSGNFKPEAAGWITEVLNDALSRGVGIYSAARMIRKSGGALSINAVKAMGLRGNTKIGNAFAESLTAQGYRDPVGASDALADLLIKQSLHQMQCNTAYQAESYGVKVGMQIMSTRDKRACPAVLALEDKVFALDQCPTLPLAECNQDMCRCCLVSTVLPE
jgi:hypothetical protein